MWRYQRPGFEILLLTELQKQQEQCSQFCDVLLEADGVSVPAHGCVVSALSSCVSSALSSMPTPPAGQSRLVEFRALGACTLLHMVRLLYSGEMAGEGEKEKQEAISAAAKLGIHGLVEVTKRDGESRNAKVGGQHVEVGVQTDPPVCEDSEGRRVKWRREVKDGNTFLWKETLPDGEKDMWTQTEEEQVNTVPPPESAASCDTTDTAALQSLGQTDSHLISSQISYVPVSLVYPPQEQQTGQFSSASVASVEDSTAAGHTSVAVSQPYTSTTTSLLSLSNQTTLCAADPQSWWTGPQGAARDAADGEEWMDEHLRQFQGNIPGFINYFLNPLNEEGSGRGRAGRRQRAGTRRPRRGGSGRTRARTPRAGRGGRGRGGGLMQTVDVQDVGVSKLQKMFLQKWGVRTPRTGQGGGSAGRKLYIKTREVLKTTKSQRIRRRVKVWDWSESGELLLHNDGRHTKRESTTQQFQQDSLAQGTSARSSSVYCSSIPSSQFSNIHTSSAPRASIQPSSSSTLLAPATSYVPPASSILHTTNLPPPATPHLEHQPQHIDHLLEAVMMGLDIIPNNNNSALESEPPLATCSNSFAPSANNLAQNKQQGCNTGLTEAGVGFHGSTQVVEVARGAGSSTFAADDVPVLQQEQGEGELNSILDHFLQSFERHIDNCNVREEEVRDGERSAEAREPYTMSNKYRQAKTQTTTPHPPRLQDLLDELQQSDKTGALPRHPPPRKASACGAVSCQDPKKKPKKDRRPGRTKKKRKNEHALSLEKTKVKVKEKSVSTGDAKIKTLQYQDKQLQQMPVVKLERHGPLPLTVTLQRHSCHSLELKSPAEIKTNGSSSRKKQPGLWILKTYPIRSRFREAQIMDTMPFLEQPINNEYQLTADRQDFGQSRSTKNKQLLSSSNGGSSTPTSQPQPAESCGMNGQLKDNHERREEVLTVQSEEEPEAPTAKGRKRRVEPAEENSDGVTAAKRFRSEQIAQPVSETCTPNPESVDYVSEQETAETEDVIDVETVSLISAGGSIREEQEVFREIKIRETEESPTDEEKQSSSDEILIVDDAEADGRTARRERLSSHSETEVGVGSEGRWDDEDVDVIGGSSPVPEPVIITWTGSSEGENEEEEDEDVDVVGEMTHYASSAIFATINKGEFVKTEMLLH